MIDRARRLVTKQFELFDKLLHSLSRSRPRISHGPISGVQVRQAGYVKPKVDDSTGDVHEDNSGGESASRDAGDSDARTAGEKDSDTGKSHKTSSDYDKSARNSSDSDRVNKD